MPKRSQEKEQEVLGQIFDFIFKEAKKKPEKRKPLKISGIDGRGLLTDGIVAALENPGVFLTSQAVKDFQDSLDLTLTKIRPDEKNPTVTMKIASSSVIDILKDPMGFAQKAKDKADAARKEGKANFLGTVMRDFTSNAWASKYADIDTQIAVRNGLTALAGNERNAKIKYASDRWRTQASIGQSASGRDALDSSSLSSMQERAGTLLGRGIFTERGWNDLSEEQRTRVGTILGMGHKKLDKNKPVSSDDPKYLSSSQYVKDQLHSILSKREYGFGYSPQEIQMVLDRYDRVLEKKDDDGDISLTNSNFYRNLELSHLDIRVRELESQKQFASPLEQRRIDSQIATLKRANLVIAGQSLNKDSLLNSRSELQKEIQQLKLQINQERDPNRRSELRRQLGEARNGNRELEGVIFWNAVGQVEGIYGSLQGIVSGSLVTDILSGDFFDPKRNTYFCPAKAVKSESGVGFYIPKVEALHDGSVNKIGSLYNSTLVNLYYLTPKSLMKTLFQNGEGFAYLNFMQSNSVANILKNSANGNALAGFLGKDGNLGDSYMKAIIDGKSPDVINQILAKSGLKGEARNLLEKQLQKRFASIAQIGKLHRFFSLNSRIKDLVSKKIEAFMKKRREALVQSLMKSKFFAKLFKEGAGKLLGQWAEKGGLQTMARALVLAVANAFGIVVSGGLANIVITGLSMVVADALFALGKVLLGIVVFALFGFIGLWFLVLGHNNTFSQNTYTYASTPPGEVYVNPAFTGTSPITGEDDDHELGDFIGGTLPEGEKCLLGSSSYSCTQGPYGSYSHQNVAAVDLTGVDSFYAPAFCGKDNCVVTYSGSAYCTAGYAGGMVKFSATYGGSTYEFTLIHVNTTYGTGTKLSAGQKVARVMTVHETTNACSSGEHIHIQTRVNGGVVNPWEVLTKATSSGGFGCNVGSCPAK